MELPELPPSRVRGVGVGYLGEGKECEYDAYEPVRPLCDEDVPYSILSLDWGLIEELDHKPGRGERRLEVDGGCMALSNQWRLHAIK